MAVRRRLIVKPPIDLDAILMHLDLRLDFDDLKTRYDLPDVLGDVIGSMIATSTSTRHLILMSSHRRWGGSGLRWRTRSATGNSTEGC